METNTFTPMEIDAIGEIMNISLGSSATAVSNLLDHRVDITTPTVTVVDSSELILGEINPAVGVEIHYVAGLEGANIMFLKRADVKVIVDILMGMETPEEEFQLNELTISAVCEVMNQMMGASSTALSDFLGRMVNISTPKSFELDDFEEFKNEHFPPEAGKLVVVKFVLSIEGQMSSEFINVITVPLARELIAGFSLDVMSESDEEDQQVLSDVQQAGGGKLTQEEVERLMADAAGAAAPAPEPSGGGGMLSQEEIERLMSGGAAETPAPAPEPSGGGGKLSQEEIERLMSGGMADAPAAAAPTPPPAPQQVPPQMQPQQPMGYPPQQEGMPPYYGMPGYYPPQPYYYPPQPQQPDPKMIPTQPLNMPKMDLAEKLGEEQAENLDLIMSVQLEVAVEIGRTRRKVQDILTFSKGALVILDKLAGDQVDLLVNGMCIAKGDVVVVDDNFGIRITEIINRPEASELLAP